MHRTTVSPSSSSTSRSTPCVAGCCGPMLISMCSPPSSGSSIGGSSTAMADPLASVTNGVRTGRPRSSSPVVARATSTVRFVVAMLFPGALARFQSLAHLVGKILERVGDRQLLHRVPRFRIGGQCLTQLLRAREAAAQGEVLSQWVPFSILLPHENAPQVGVPGESYAEHVVALALEPIGSAVHRPHALDLERRPSRQLDLETEEASQWQRSEVPDHLERPLRIAELHRRHIREID